LEHREKHLKGERKRGKKHFRFDIYARLFIEFGGFVSGRPDDFDLDEWAQKRRIEWGKKAGKAHKENKPSKRRKESKTVKGRKRRKNYKTKGLSSK
jgi:hypothetical protein